VSAATDLLRRQPTALLRAEARVVRRLLSGRPLEQLGPETVLGRLVRFPIPDEYFELALPSGRTAAVHAESAPYQYWAGLQTFEPAALSAFREHARGVRHFVDVGAAFGLYTLLAHDLSPSATLTAVEPNPRHAAVLEQTLRRNGLDARLLRLAVDDRPGIVSLSLAGGHSSIESGRWADDAPTVDVASARLDDVLEEQPDLVKIDAEGAELRIFRGMERILREARPVVLCEIAPENLGAAFELLDGHAYDVHELPSRRRVARGEQSLTENFLLLPR
jgi:FkbM family methyltransferase